MAKIHSATPGGAAALALLLAGCSGDGSRTAPPHPDAGADDVGTPDSGPPPLPADFVTDLTVTPNPSNVLSAFVDYRTAAPVATRVEFQCEGDELRVVEASEAGTEHEILVLGLRAESTCRVTAVAEASTGAQARASVDHTVGDLPDFLPELHLEVPQPDAVQSGWTAFVTGRHGQVGIPLKIVMVDERGEYRWIYSASSTMAASDNDLVVVDDGMVVGGNLGQYPAFFVEWSGDVRWEEGFFDRGGMHHDIGPFGEPGQYLVLLRSIENCPILDDGTPSTGGLILHWDSRTGEELWEWNLCDHYTPSFLEFDWSHTNAVAVVPGEDALLLSSRHQDAIWKIDRTSGDIVWRLGRDGDFTLEPEGAEWFGWQHDPEPQPNGNVLLFDNRRFLEAASSRVLELALDEATMTATIVYEFEPEPGILAYIWGDADRLPNGNTLSTFGLRTSDLGSHIIETDAEEREVWHLETPIEWGIYRAQRLTEPPSGFVLEP